MYRKFFLSFQFIGTALQSYLCGVQTLLFFFGGFLGGGGGDPFSSLKHHFNPAYVVCRHCCCFCFGVVVFCCFLGGPSSSLKQRFNTTYAVGRHCFISSDKIKVDHAWHCSTSCNCID